MADLGHLLQQLRLSRFEAISGAQLAATVPVPEPMINQIIAETMPRDLPVRQVTVHPEGGDRLTLRLVPRTAFLPAVTIKLAIDRQPELPGSPVLVLRMLTLPAFLGLAGAAFSLDKVLPPGVRLHGEVILVDFRALAAEHGAGDLFALATVIRVSTAPGRLILHLEAQVPASTGSSPAGS